MLNRNDVTLPDLQAIIMDMGDLAAYRARMSGRAQAEYRVGGSAGGGGGGGAPMMAAPSFVSYDTGPNPFAALAQPPPMQPMHYPQPPSLPHPPSEPYPVRAPPPGIPKERISASSLPLLPWVSKDEPPSTTLEVYQNSEHVQTIVLDQSFVVLGRDGASGCNVVLKSSSASRCHAILGYDAADQRWYVMDQASTFGTLLDGKKLEAKKKCEVEDRSSLKFGEASSKM